MPAYISKDTGNGREAYLESEAQEYAAKEAALKAAHEAGAPTFAIWGVECPIVFNSSSICIGADSEGFYPYRDKNEAIKSGKVWLYFSTHGRSATTVESEIFSHFSERNVGGCWE